MISGGIKWFERSKSLLNDGASISASPSGASTADNAIDLNPDTYLRSTGSDDTVTETYIVTFAGSATINRLLLIDHNWKHFNVKYDLSGTYTAFTNVVGLDGAVVGGITQTAFTDGTAYYEFDSVTTTSIRIEVLKTQVVDDQKYIAQIFPTFELGTLQGYPGISPIHSRNSRIETTLSGRAVVQKSTATIEFTLDFSTYPSGTSYHADLDLMESLFDSEDTFVVWLCGGRRGSTYFRYPARGFNLEDVYNVQVTSPFPISYYRNLYTGPVNLQISFKEFA